MKASFVKSSIFVLALTAVATGPAAAQGTLKVKFITPAVLDPIWTTSYVVRMHGFLVYDTLFGSDENQQPKPQMVESWSASDDRMTYNFTLRNGLKWHDGDPVTAEDCVASIKRWGARDVMGQSLMKATKSLDVVDARTFKLILAEPFGSVIEALAKVSSNVAFMMKKAQASTDPYTQVTEAIGSGPFKFVREEFQPGVKAVYVKNPDYTPRSEPASNTSGGKIAHVDRVEIISIPDPQTAVNALISGEVDVVYDPIADLLPVLKSAKGVAVEVFDPFGLQSMVRINHLLPPFDNPKARQAILYALDQETTLRAAVGNDPSLYKICHTMFVCGGPFATEAGSEPYMKADPEKARQLLRQAGYNGEEIVLMQTTDEPIINAQSPVVIQALRRIGLNVRVDAVDWATLLKRRANNKSIADGGWHMYVNWLSGLDMLSPITNIAVAAQCDKAWFGWPCDEQIERLRTAFARELDSEKRKAITADIQKRAYEVVTYVPLGFIYQPVAYRSDRVEGLVRSSAVLFWNARKKQ
jgi:peptide/nickel transport system substrate-binding protein